MKRLRNLGNPKGISFSRTSENMLDYVPKTKMSKINGISGKYKEL